MERAIWTLGATVALVIAAVAMRLPGGPVDWWLPLGIALLAGPAAVVVSMAVDQVRQAPHRAIAAVAGCGWVAVIALRGWSGGMVVGLIIATGVVATLEVVMAPTAGIVMVRPGQDVAPVAALPTAPARPTEEMQWERLLQRVTKTRKRKGESDPDEWESAELHVTAVRPWPDPTAGQQVHVTLPLGMTVKNLADFADRIASARWERYPHGLPQGCVVRALEAAHQGAAILDVMLRDVLADGSRKVVETAEPASINDPFEIASTARGEVLDVCLRQKGMVIGGTTGSGKTTLLHRIIMRLARCTDALIWVIDLNGGGVAAPWIGAYARGEADRPTIDMVAEDEVEAAVMIAIAAQVAKDRKTNRDAVRRKRAANTTVLPVDAGLPAIIILADEGGEIRQTVGLLARLVDEGLQRVAQIARAEGVRTVMSVLRGTGDLLGKGLRSVTGIRVCLRMDEEGEYDHVLGKNPGRTRLLHVGSAYVYRTDTDYRPVLARTVDVDLASIERHSVATAHLRPQLDERARRIAARLTVADIIEGRNPDDYPELADHPVMRDVAAGRAYEGRWDRKAAMLAELRGEDLADDDAEPEQPARPVGPRTVAAAGSAMERLLLATGVTKDTAPAPPQPADPVAAEAERLLSPEHLARPAAQHAAASEQPQTARAAILAALSQRQRRMTATEVHAAVTASGVEVTPQRVHQVLGQLAQRGEVSRQYDRYELATEAEAVRQ